MEITTTYTFPLPTEETTKFFEKGCWYKGKNGDKGIIAKSSGEPEKNIGWWSGEEFVTRLISPENWDKITDKEEIKELEDKAKTHKLWKN